MTKKEPVTPAFGAFLSKCQKEQLVNGKHQPDTCHNAFWRSFPKTDQERESFEKEVADCLESDLRNYRIHTGVLKP